MDIILIMALAVGNLAQAVVYVAKHNSKVERRSYNNKCPYPESKQILNELQELKLDVRFIKERI